MSAQNNEHIFYTWTISEYLSNGFTEYYSPIFGDNLQLRLERNDLRCLWQLHLTSQNDSIYEGTLDISIRGCREKFERKCKFILPDYPPKIQLGTDHELNGLYGDDDKLEIECKITGKGAKIVNDPSYELANDFGTLLDTKEMADVVIITGDGQKIPAHKLVLSARSKMFAAMFKHPMKENTENCITISDMSYDVIMEMLRYMYTGNSPNLKEMNVDLIAAAEKYQLEGLKAICEKSMWDNLSIETAPVVLKTADLYNMDHLKSMAVQFIKKNILKVNKTSNWRNLSMTDGQLILKSFIDPIYLEYPNDEIKENV